MVECLRLSVVERWHESPLASMEDDVFRRRFPRKTRNEFRPDSGVLTEFRKVKKTSQTRASSKSYAPSVDQFWPKLAVFAGRSYSLRVQRTRDSFISFGNSEKRFFFFWYCSDNLLPPKVHNRGAEVIATNIESTVSAHVQICSRKLFFGKYRRRAPFFAHWSTRIQYTIIGYAFEKKGVDETSEISIGTRVNDSPPRKIRR